MFFFSKSIAASYSTHFPLWVQQLEVLFCFICAVAKFNAVAGTTRRHGLHDNRKAFGLREMAHVFPGLTSNGETMPSLNLQWLSGFLMPRNKTIPPKILGSSECLTPKRKAVFLFQVFLELSDHKRNEQIASLLPSRHPAGVVCHVDSVHLQYHFHANPETPTRHLPPAKMIGKNWEKSKSHIFWHVVLCVVSWKSHNFDLALTPVSPPQITANGSAFVAWRRASAVKDRLAFSSTLAKLAAFSLDCHPPTTQAPKQNYRNHLGEAMLKAIKIRILWKQ